MMAFVADPRLIAGERCPLCSAPARSASTERVVSTHIRSQRKYRAREIIWRCAAGHTWASDGRPILPVDALDDWDGY